MPAYLKRTGLASGTDLTGLNATTGFTVAFWLRCLAQEGAAPSGDIWRHTSTANASRDGYAIWLNGGAIGGRIAGSAASTDFGTFPNHRPRHRVWAHFIVRFDNAANQVCFFHNGMLAQTTANTRDMTSNVSCTTQMLGSNYQGDLLAEIFDVQVFPDVVVPNGDVRRLLRPDFIYPGCKGRYYGLGFRSLAASGVVVDESGSGNHLTGPAVVQAQAPEPPWRATIA
jgi:hypothetical protein